MKRLYHALLPGGEIRYLDCRKRLAKKVAKRHGGIAIKDSEVEQIERGLDQLWDFSPEQKQGWM